MKRGEINNLLNSNKKAQVTIFIIVAIIIVVLAFGFYVLFPKIKSNIGFGEQNPSSFMQACLEDSLEETIQTISSQGGSVEPEHYYTYNSQNIEYLCYVEGYYKTCVVQRPLLIKHIQDEIKNNIEPDAKNCLEELKSEYESQGYNVDMNQNGFDVELLPDTVSVTFNTSMVLSSDETKKFDSAKVSIQNNLYELLSIANSIVSWEAKYGDAEITTYMNYYHNLKVEKKKQSEGTTIYILTNIDNGDKFQFASRSVAWPPGYGTSEVY